MALGTQPLEGTNYVLDQIWIAVRIHYTRYIKN
jgi:hypothetical protein